jgi:hypothetical protein
MKTKRKKNKRKKTLKRKTFKKNNSQKGGGDRLGFLNTMGDHCHIDSDDLPHKEWRTSPTWHRGRLFGLPATYDYIHDPIQDEILRNIRDYNIINCKIHKVRLNDDGSTESIKRPEVIPLGGQRTIIYPWSPDNDLLSGNYIFSIPYDEPNKLYYFSLDEGEVNRCYAVSRDDSTYHENYNSEINRRYFHYRMDEPEAVSEIRNGEIYLKPEITHNCLVRGRNVIIAGKIIKVEVEDGRNIFIITNSSGHYIPRWNDYSIDLIKRFFYNVNDRLVIVNNITEEGYFLQGYQYLHGIDLLDEEFKGIIRDRL